ncbi:GntR family transcriptional regulator [Jatrophihabitans fulvus]
MSDAPRRAPTRVSGRLAVQLARRIEDDVVAGRRTAGDALGSATELQLHYGMSRAVVREAIRVLEHERVARARRGPGGGLVVSRPSVEPTTRSLASYLHYTGAGLDDLLEARLVLGRLAVRLAAERVDRQEIERLRSGLSSEAEQCDSGAPVEFWSRPPLLSPVARAGGNPALLLLLDVVHLLLDRCIQPVRQRLPDGDPRVDIAFRSSRRGIVDAIVAGRADDAVALLAARAADTGAWMRAHGAPAGVPADAPEGGRVDAALAGWTADRVRRDVAASGWPIGAPLGTERDLAQRYAVGRDAAREAVCLLESDGVVAGRRGRGGGLVVTAPTAQRVLERLATDLRRRQIAPHHLIAVRRVLESLDSCGGRTTNRVVELFRRVG